MAATGEEQGGDEPRQTSADDDVVVARLRLEVVGGDGADLVDRVTPR
jgi:hypothetical protein